MNRRIAAGLVVVALFLGGASYAIASTSGPQPVACTYDGSTLACPLPQQTVTETTTVSATATATADPVTVFTTATVTTTVGPPTVTVPPSTATVTKTTTRTVTATPSTTTSSTKPTTTAPTTTSAPTGAFPDSSNTGVPAGVILTSYTGPCTITAANTVIDAKAVTCDLVIKAAGVKITRSKITGSVATDENSTGYSYSISDSYVDAGNRPATGVGAVNFTMTRVEVIGGNRSVNCYINCTVTDSYVHGQFKDISGVAHESGMRLGSGSTIRHNTILCDAPDVAPDAGCSADLTGYGDFATVQNDTIDGNLFKSTTGGYCAYGGSSAGKPYPNANHVAFTNNVFERGTTRPSDHGTYICGYYGAITAFDTAAPGNVWSGNVYADGSPVAAQ